MGMPNYGGPTPPPPPPLPPQSKSNATTALILGIVSVVCCQILGPIAWYLGNKELQAIKAGAAPITGEGSAKAGMILGIIGTILFALSILWIVLWGGMAMLGGIFSQGSSF